MPDETPAAPDAAPAEDLSPAVPAAPVTIPSPDNMLAAIKERIAKANAPEPPPKVEGEPDAAPTLKIDPKTMRTLGRLQEEARTSAAKVKELEPLKPDAEFGKAIRDMWKGTPEQKLEALAKLSGKDGTDELAALVTFFYERDQQTPPGDAAKAQPSAEMKALFDKLDTVSKELAEIKSRGTTDAEAKAKQDADSAKAAAGQFVERFLTTNKARFEISARKENVSEATDLIQEAALAIVTRDRIDIKSLTEEAANDLYLKAATEVEKEYEDTGKRFQKAQPRYAFDPDKYARHLSKPAVTLKRDPPSSDPKVREAQLRARLLEKLANGQLT